MGDRPALFLGLLADQPELIAEVGVLRWRAAGSAGTPGPWIQATAASAGRDSLPLTLAAMDLEGDVIGAVTLDPVGSDVPVSCEAHAPWALHMVVRPGERMCGVGRLIVSALEDLAREHGHDQLWVAAGDAEADFYRRCGWTDSEATPAATVLTKHLVPT